MTNGRAKGLNFERDIRRLIIDHLGFDDVKRDLEQYRSGDRGDIIGVPGWVIECKRYSADRGSSGSYRPEWWEQVTTAANAQCSEPVLIYKYDRQPIRCVVLLSSINADYIEMDYTATISFDAWCMLVRESI